jgi:cold shock CspA family protein
MKQLPPTLQLNGHQLNFSGPGRTAGSHLYLDMALGHVHELYLAQVEATGPVFSLAAIAGNHALRQVQVEHSTLQGNGHPQVGDVLLLEVKYMPGRPPQAKAAWLLTARPAQPVPKPRPMSRPQAQPAVAPRYLGTLMEIHGNTGTLIEDRTGERVFIHRHQVVHRPFRPGTRVSYRRSHNTHGACAAEVQAA